MAQSDDRLIHALKAARAADSAHREALLNLSDAKALRLRLLQEDVEEALAGQPLAAGLMDLAVAPGETPHLWIDLVSRVVMEPDPATFRFVEEGRGVLLNLFETPDREAMAAFILRHLAQRIVTRERLLAAAGRAGGAGAERAAGEPAASPDSSLRGGYSAAALIYAWASGFALGFMLLAIAAILLGKIAI